MTRVRKIGVILIAMMTAAGTATGHWLPTLAAIGFTVAVIAEIDISLHRRDHERRQRDRRAPK